MQFCVSESFFKQTCNLGRGFFFDYSEGDVGG